MIQTAKGFLIMLIILILGGTILGYTYYRTKNFIRGPQIVLTYPRDGDILDDSLVTIAGTARDVDIITLNGRNIFIDESGALEEQLLLSYGYNIITVTGRDRFGRETIEVLELLYQ